MLHSCSLNRSEIGKEAEGRGRETHFKACQPVRVCRRGGVACLSRALFLNSACVCKSTCGWLLNTLYPLFSIYSDFRFRLLQSLHHSAARPSSVRVNSTSTFFFSYSIADMNLVLRPWDLWACCTLRFHWRFLAPLGGGRGKQMAAAIDRAVRLCTRRCVLCCRTTGTLKNWAADLIWGGSVCPCSPSTALSTWTELALYFVDMYFLFYLFIQSLTHSLSHQSH